VFSVHQVERVDFDAGLEDDGEVLFGQGAGPELFGIVDGHI
jgi:hypothetical protein